MLSLNLDIQDALNAEVISPELEHQVRRIAHILESR